MDSGQNPTSPMPGNGLNSVSQPGSVPPANPAASSTPTTPVTGTTASAPTAAPVNSAPIFSAPQPAATPASPLGGLRSRRNRSARPNSANSMIAPAQSMTPTGDVLMDMPVGTKKPVMNKGLIIGLIIAAIAVVAIVVVLAVLPKGGGGSTSVNAINNQAFNRFANYIINGEDSTTPVADTDKTTQLEVSIATPEARSNYLSTGKELLDAFMQEVNDSDNLKNYSNLVETATALRDYYEVIYETYRVVPLNYQSILKLYSSDGANLTENTINNHYQNLLNSKNEDISKYASDMLESAKIQLAVFKKYSQYGCLQNGIVNNDCVKNINFSDVDTSKILGLEMEANRIQKSATNNVIGIISSISSMLRDRSDLDIQETSNGNR